MANNDGCFVGSMKSIILLLFIGAFVLLIGREVFTKDFVKVAQKSPIPEFYKQDIDISYKEAFDKIFKDGEWEQKKKQGGQSYQHVIYTGKYVDSAGSHPVEYELSFSDDLSGFLAHVYSCKIDGEEHDSSIGLGIIYKCIVNP